jgi:glyoxylase-like metal-dependent hydrolase (beta-lactamase superfamily II)
MGAKMEQLTKNIYVETEIRGCDPSIVFTAEGAVFIDTAQWISKLLEMRAFALERGPIKYLINTESHIDHIFGNHWFAGECDVIGHERITDGFWKIPEAFHMTTYEYSLDVIRRQDPAAIEQMPAEEDFQISPPNILFSDRMSLKLGDHEFKLYYTPGHSDANISVFVPKERTVFVGDSVFSGCQIWFHSIDFDKLFKTLDFIGSLDVDHIVPGHGPVVGKNYLFEQKAFLHEWLQAVGLGMSRGWSKEECVARISFADRCPVDIGQEEVMEYIQTYNVRACYDYLSAKQGGF